MDFVVDVIKKYLLGKNLNENSIIRELYYIKLICD